MKPFVKMSYAFSINRTPGLKKKLFYYIIYCEFGYIKMCLLSEASNVTVHVEDCKIYFNKKTI